MNNKELPNHLKYLEDNLNKMARTRMLYSVISIAAIILILSTGTYVAEESNAGSFVRGIDNFFDYPIALFAKTFDAGFSWFGYVLDYVPDLLYTFNMALFSTIVGAILALILSVFASGNLIKNKTIVWTARRIMDICRAFPELVLAITLLYLLGRSPIPAVIAIIIHTAGALGKLFSEAIENADNKQIEGLESVGSSWLSRIRFGVLPQVMPILLSYGLLRAEINVRASTILGFVGAGGIGEQLNTLIQWNFGAKITAVMFLLILTITLLDYFSTFTRQKLIGGSFIIPKDK